MPYRASVALVLLLPLNAAPAAPAHPVVPGFERFFASGKGEAAGAGRLLLGELNCTSCHQAVGAGPARKQAPVLDVVGTRVRAGYLRKFLSDPHTVKPGTTMPALFVDDPDRASKVEALVHYLAATGSPRHERLDLKGVARGRDLYGQVGCVACHGPRDDLGDARAAPATVVPLGDLKTKYTVAGLAAFLDNPHQTRPAGRMPKILSGKEAKDVACYLLQGMKGELLAGKGTMTFAYYEGSWSRVPDFATLKPHAAGNGPAFDVGVARRADNYALRFEGYFKAERDGEYKFAVGSDDGSWLQIDGKLVVDNDGEHATQWKQSAVRLTKGIHKVTAGFFQLGGGAELEVRVEGPGLPHQDLAGLVAPTEAAINKPPVPVKKDEDDSLDVQPALVAKGKALFASAGCASCHPMATGGQTVASTLKASPLDPLKGIGGCLAAAPAPGVPSYALSEVQRSALAAALKSPPAEAVARTLVTFNCYACHARDKVGGPEEALNASFRTTQPEMGDEARVPPPLDGVGAKLNPDYLRKILDQGAHDRPYMLTRMPGFGAANVGPLVEAFAALDRLPPTPPVAFGLTPPQVKATGRKLVGDEAFSCIKCHTFAGHKAEGVQGMDMTLLTQRLRRDWFHAYVNDPQRIRPGTRMPSGFDKGRSLLPKVLDGSAAAQIEAMWQYLADGTSARLPAGLRKQSMPLVPDKTAIIYRNFIEGAGTRAIAVGYPEKAHLAFDANDLRLALLWQGAFLDAARHWTDRGGGFEGPLGDNILHLPAGPAFAVLETADAVWPKASAKSLGQRFLGYRVTPDERPTFLYEVAGARVEDFPNPTVGKEPSLRRTLTLTATKPVENLFFRAAVGDKVEAAGDGWFKVDGSWRLKIEGDAAPRVRHANGRAELLVPVRFADGKARVVLEYVW